MPPLQRTIYTGTFIYTPTLGTLSIREHLAVGVDEEGVIRHITDISPSDQQYSRDDAGNATKRVKAVAVKWGWGETGWKWVVGGKEGRNWWFPGFVGKLYYAGKVLMRCCVLFVTRGFNARKPFLSMFLINTSSVAISNSERLEFLDIL